jgi:predicted DNA-binding transcriptional regulator AlpA
VNTAKKLWTVSELSDYLGVPKSWIYDRTGPEGIESLPHFKIGKYLRFDPESEEFKAWLQRSFKNDPETR